MKKFLLFVVVSMIVPLSFGGSYPPPTTYAEADISRPYNYVTDGMVEISLDFTSPNYVIIEDIYGDVGEEVEVEANPPTVAPEVEVVREISSRPSPPVVVREVVYVGGWWYRPYPYYYYQPAYVYHSYDWYSWDYGWSWSIGFHFRPGYHTHYGHHSRWNGWWYQPSKVVYKTVHKTINVNKTISISKNVDNRDGHRRTVISRTSSGPSRVVAKANAEMPPKTQEGRVASRSAKGSPKAQVDQKISAGAYRSPKVQVDKKAEKPQRQVSGNSRDHRGYGENQKSDRPDHKAERQTVVKEQPMVRVNEAVSARSNNSRADRGDRGNRGDNGGKKGRQ